MKPFKHIGFKDKCTYPSLDWDGCQTSYEVGVVVASKISFAARGFNPVVFYLEPRMCYIKHGPLSVRNGTDPLKFNIFILEEHSHSILL